jgi:nucleoside phosphorylase
MKLGVLAALQTEIKPTLQALAASSQGRIYTAGPYSLAVGGVGAEKAAAGALHLIQTVKPDALLSVGFCGAITGDLDIGDLLLGGTTRYPADPELLSLARSAAAKSKSGTVATVTRVLNQAADKKLIADKTGARAIDMEADAVGKAAADAGLKFLCVKAVIDTPGQPLASNYESFWSVFKDIILRPGSIMGMVYDAKRVKVASEVLRDFFVAFKDATK